jgi:hypothetical protein
LIALLEFLLTDIEHLIADEEAGGVVKLLEVVHHSSIRIRFSLVP